jgi:hypothetical protein
LAEWIGGDEEALATSDWKPSAERFGLLRWTGDRVRLQWLGEYESSNPRFVVQEKLGPRRNGGRLFPKTKSEAVAATAVRLSTQGSVMVFTAKAKDAPSMAKSVLAALRGDDKPYPWPQREWAIFEAVCDEELSPESIEFTAARLGVICHSASLPMQVRWAIEQLMRAKPARIIVATTTLAQGVNVGVSTVIVANAYQSQEMIDKRSFWNICGRAGRAFVDGEGRILYALDETKGRTKTNWMEKQAKDYFGGVAGDPVRSGVLALVRWLRRTSVDAGVPFEYALELIAENDFSAFGEEADRAAEYCDLLDDGLLALQADLLINTDGREPEDWVDDLFRQSLAVIQAGQLKNSVTRDEVFAFIKARIRWGMKATPNDAHRRAVIASGLPLQAAVKVRENLDWFKKVVGEYVQSDGSPEVLEDTVARIEAWATREVPTVIGVAPDAATLDRIRSNWLTALGMREMNDAEPSAQVICRDFYGYALPWIIHAVAQQLRSADEVHAEALDRVALLVEIGVPTELAARIFLAGVRSRVAAAEIAKLEGQLAFSSNLGMLARQLGSPRFFSAVRTRFSERTQRWLELIKPGSPSSFGAAEEFPSFTIPVEADEKVLRLVGLGDDLYLCGPDFRTQIAVESDQDLPFDQVANVPGIVFEPDGSGWRLTIRDPRLE